MTEDEPRWQHGPVPSGNWIAEHARRIREESDAADDERERVSAARTVTELRDIAERHVEAFSALPCRGSLDGIGACSEAFALTCERRTSPSCPREIYAFDQSREREELTALFVAAGAPKDAMDAVLWGFRPTSATMAVDRFLASSARILVLAGAVGVGKTVAAAYAMRRRRGYCRFVAAAKLTDTAGFEDRARRDRQAIYDCGLLVVDDVGTEYGDAKGWFQSVLEPLLVDRHGQKRLTIVTCNLDASAFSARYGERIVDRIAGSGMFVPLVGPSLRRRAA